MKRILCSILALSLLASLAIFATACGDDDYENDNGSESGDVVSEYLEEECEECGEYELCDDCFEALQSQDENGAESVDDVTAEVSDVAASAAPAASANPPAVSRAPTPAPQSHAQIAVSFAPPQSRAPAPPPPPPQSVAPAPVSVASGPHGPSAIEQEVLTLTNQHRAAHGVPALQWDNRLGTASRAHSIAMHSAQNMTHNLGNSTMTTRINESGFVWSRIAENVAQGQPTARAVVDAWIASEGHNANLLNPEFTHMGAGYHLGDGARRNYWTQKFARQR